MKKLLLTGFLFLLLSFAVFAQNQPSIRIVNNTGYSIELLVISPSDDDEWGKDVLNGKILENGQTFTYQLPHPLNKVSVYDIGMQDTDGDAYIKWEVTVTNNARIVFTADDLEEDD